MANRSRSTRWRPLVAVLLCASLLGACASVPAQSNGASDPYAGTNRALRGHAAIVELASGEVAAPVRQVVVGREETTWLGEDGPDSAPTESVRRVIALRRYSGWQWGLLAALVGTAILVDEDVALDLALDVAVDLAFAYLESGGGELPPELGKIVYSAPTEAH